MTAQAKAPLISPGDKYGKLTVIERNIKKEEQTPYRVTFWRCRCECGKLTTVNQLRLRAGTTRSCGCLKANRKLY